MSNYRVIRFVAGGEMRFRLEDVIPEKRLARFQDCRGILNPFVQHDSLGMGYESPEDIRSDLLAKLAALDKPHMYVEHARVVEVK